MRSDRIPALAGALNFRDLGGYAAADGRSVRWNTLYRSGTTHAMTAGDLAQLASRGIRVAYDLRSNKERRDHPNRLTEIAHLDYRFRDHHGIPGDIGRLLRSQGVRQEHSRELMLSLYQQLPYDFEEAFRALFQLLAAGELPLVFNCTAGKDRTGVAAALILSALGVASDAILEDYLLTEQFFERSCEMILDEKNMALFGHLDRAIWEPLMRVHADYLHAMFDRLRESHGSVEHYLRDQLGIDEKQLSRLRSNLLE